MRLSRQAALAVALILGLAAVILGYFYLRGQEPAPEEPQQVQLPVPVRDIPAQTDLTLDMFEPATVEADQVPSNAVRDANDLVGQIALQPLPEGQSVTRGKIAERSASLALAYGIPEGLRGITIAVDKVSGVANFIRPGDYVDYLTVFTSPEGAMSLCETVLQNVQVLAVDHDTQPATKEQNGNRPETRGGEQINVTLAVSPHQAQLVTLSDSRGSVRLVLRRTGDHQIASLQPTLSWTAFRTFPEEEQPATPSEPPEPMPEQPPSWAEMWGGPPTQPPTRPTEPKPTEAPEKPAEQGGIEVIRGSSREYVNPAN